MSRSPTGLLLIGLSLGASALEAPAATCPVPGGPHATIQEAVDDPSCSAVSLSPGAYGESVLVDRSLSLTGAGSASTTLEGRLEILGSGAQVSLGSLAVLNGCPSVGIRVSAGAQVVVADVTVEPAALPCPPLDAAQIFDDGFETGDTSGWSGSPGRSPSSTSADLRRTAR